MIVTHKGGDILKSNLQALVNPVDCTGVVVGGLNYQFSRYSPGCAEAYSAMCHDGSLRLGTLGHFFDTSLNQHIILFPTRAEGHGPASKVNIMEGLQLLRTLCFTLGIRQIAIPALGCGYGGLRAEDVFDYVETVFVATDIETHFFEPKE